MSEFCSVLCLLGVALLPQSLSRWAFFSVVHHPRQHVGPRNTAANHGWRAGHSCSHVCSTTSTCPRARCCVHCLIGWRDCGCVPKEGTFRSAERELTLCAFTWDEQTCGSHALRRSVHARASLDSCQDVGASAITAHVMWESVSSLLSLRKTNCACVDIQFLFRF